ncbi:A-kinase anchor protein 1, mitochondrial [Cuculus canorus]|uniref:A-kinase anchor protein 1, mitochondrial n=1 Tax=Cuculus canorus TaxID=55661 RepID=UPI0023AA4EA6|nr:A-kinase anchor protein 1, mitochondrial [Cuculus canorus]XP_053941159.1 A-kinase anchor protein 1, mitochondrial [Cuculus canorus]XP_053941160.1 A-kinase anchor protein 1, mitochondrial [Cuculus canorus]XP_053941161.1 A-kinase anchor protein 1, mitochondrial [Cuculus canorus]
MALRFRDVMIYAVPGAVGLLGCWWIYSHRKRHASYHDKQAIDTEEQQEVLENDSSPKPAVCVPRRLHLLSEEECPENETSTYLLSAGSMTPSLLCQSHGRLDLSQDLPDLSAMTIHPSTLEDDSEKLETVGFQDESGFPACVSLPLISKSTECDSSAAVSLVLDSSSSANQDQWPSESVTLTQKSLGIMEISNAEQSDDSSLKPPKESQMPEMVLSGTGSVTAVSLGLEKKAHAPQAFLDNEVVSSHKDSAVSTLPDSLESVCLEQTRDEKSESIAGTVPVCHEEDTQPKGDELEREKIGGLCLDKEEVGKIEQVAIHIISKVILAATEEVLSGSVSDVSTRICQAAASRVERPLVLASVSSDQMLAEEATIANENIAAQSDAAVLTHPQTKERDQSVTGSGCLTHGCLSITLQGDTGDCGVKNRVCSEGVLSGLLSDVSTRACQAAASCVETPLEAASILSSDQVLVEKATVVNENIAAQSDAAVLTSLQTEERDQCVADSSCLTHDRLSGLVQGGTKDCGMKNVVCSESQGVDWTHVENHGGSLEKSPLVMEDSGYSTYTSECGTSVEDPLPNTMLSGTSGQHSDSLSISATQDTFAEQSSVPSDKTSALKLPEDSIVPYSNGVLKEDGPDLCSECTKAVGMDGDHLEGSDVNRMDFVDSGCAMRKTMTHQNSKLRGQSSKSDVIIWEIEVPKDLVGRLIGRQGRFMSFLRQASGAKIYVSTLPYFRDSQVCHIEGSPQQVDKVLNLIGQKFKELSLSNIYGLPPPAPLTLHSLLMTAWLFLPDGVTVEVVVAHQINAGHMFLQQHTHPTFHVLRSLDQQMYACYSQPEIPTLLTPVEVGIICAAPGLDGAWLRAQVVNYFEETNEVELRYVDYGGYEKVKIDTLRQIRSDFLTLPFQGAEVLLDNVMPLPDEDHFSSEADAAVSEMTRGAVLVAQVTNYDSATGLPMIHLWNLTGDEVVSVNRTLVERGLARWLDY